jgi:glycosyltransferase involved in cell wall biosynthesis
LRPDAVSVAPPALRVLFLAPQPFYEVRGTPLAVDAFVRVLASRGHLVDLLTFPAGAAWEAPCGARHLRSFSALGSAHFGVRPGFSVRKLLLDIPFAWRAATLVRTGAYDVVHAVEEAALLVAPFLPHGPRFVVDMDSDLEAQLRAARSPLARLLSPIASALHRVALRRADLAVVINESLQSAVRAVRPELAVRRIEDPPLVDSNLSLDPLAANRLRRDLALGDLKVALYTGNFERYQGVDLLVAAAEQAPRAAFVFVGGEPSDIARFEANVAARGIANRCRFAGKRPPAELPDWLSLADVLVSPRSDGGNTPFKIYTYMASGKPIVATRLDTHTQVLDCDTAWLVDPTAEGLARGIGAALADPAESARRAGISRDRVRLNFSVERYREKVAEAYAFLVATSGRPA